MFSKPTKDGVMFYDKVLAPHEFPFVMALSLAESIDEGVMLNAYVDGDEGLGIVELGPYDYYLYSTTDTIDIISIGNGIGFAEALYIEVLHDILTNKEEYEKYADNVDEMLGECMCMEIEEEYRCVS